MAEIYPIVDTDWLAEHRSDCDVRIVHVHYVVRFEGDRVSMPDEPETFLAGHIPGAVFAGVESSLSRSDPGGWTDVPTAEQFAETMARLGISDETMVVAYDDAAVPLGASRLWWLLRYYGHDRVVVLNGGWRKWKAQGRSISTEVAHYQPGRFHARLRPELRATKHDVLQAIGDDGVTVIDCMSQEMHAGRARRQRGVRDGRIPGSGNVAWLATARDNPQAGTDGGRLEALADPERFFCYLPPANLAALYESQGVVRGSRVITYCEGGFAACNGALTLAMLGIEAAVYDRSWAEWSRDPSLPVDRD